VIEQMVKRRSLTLSGDFERISLGDTRAPQLVPSTLLRRPWLKVGERRHKVKVSGGFLKAL
jgi:hypothetical protein